MVRKQEVDQHPPDGWPELMAHYGNAMLQVGKLEQEVQALREALRQATSQPDGHVGLLQQLEERNGELSQQAETVVALRLQIDSLNAQLDRQQDYTRQSDGMGYTSRHRHRRHRRYWWELWHPRRHSRSASSSGPLQAEQGGT